MAEGTRKNLARAALAAGAAAAAGYYFYGSKNAEKHRNRAAKWARDLKAEAMRQAEKMPKIDKNSIAKAIDVASGAILAARTIDQKEVVRAASELKNYWQNMVAEMHAKKTAPKRTRAKGGAAKKRAKNS